MNDDEQASSLKDLEGRLNKARKTSGLDRDDPPPTNPTGVAMRLGTELVVAVGFGAGLGWMLDNWLDTKPLFLVIFLFLGAGAGVINVARTAKEIGVADEDVYDRLGGDDTKKDKREG